MNNCPQCTGFLPASAQSCPNCDSAVPRSLLRHASRAAVGAMAALTLMACYGGGADDWGTSNNCRDYDNDGICETDDCDDQDNTVGTTCPCVDADADGSCAEDDCNDFDPSRQQDCCTDDDGDGFCVEEDCNDHDAAVAEHCDDICQSTTPIVVGVTAGSTVDAVDQTATCGGGTGDVVYTLTVEGEAGVVQFVSAQLQADTPHFLATRAACLNAGDIACGAEPPVVELLAAPGDTYWLIVEAADGANGDYQLTVNVDPLVCGDGAQIGPEECDDGNLVDGDGCDASCRLEASK